jgi:glycosyltransferase involved in cell wall biosynthesis
MALPTISLVVPSYNQGQFIEETLLSIFGQNYPNLEVLVMDGGSTDQTVEILRRYEDRLAFWRSQRDGGQAAAINEAFARCHGEVLCWLNSDDMYFPGTLLDVGQRMAGRLGSPHLIYGSTVNFRQDSKGLEANAHVTGPFDREQLTYTDPISQPSSFWTRALWEATGPLRAEYHCAFDWEWYIRASRQIDFERVERFYALYRWHAAQKTSGGYAKRREEILAVVREYASPYWSGLYEAMAEHCVKVNSLAEALAKRRVPKPRTWAMLAAPQVLWKARTLNDIRVTLGML